MALLLIPGLVLAQVAWARTQYFGDELSRAVARYDKGAGISIDDAVKMVEKMFKARVVRADVSEEGGRKVYVLRLLSDKGRVWSVTVDADTGELR